MAVGAVLQDKLVGRAAGYAGKDRQAPAAGTRWPGHGKVADLIALHGIAMPCSGVTTTRPRCRCGGASPGRPAHFRSAARAI